MRRHPRDKETAILELEMMVAVTMAVSLSKPLMAACRVVLFADNEAMLRTRFFKNYEMD